MTSNIPLSLPIYLSLQKGMNIRCYVVFASHKGKKYVNVFVKNIGVSRITAGNHVTTKDALHSKILTNDVTGFVFFLNIYKYRFRAAMQISSRCAESVWEAFRVVVETQSRSIDSNTSILL